jgi:hypothetical protein
VWVWVGVGVEEEEEKRLSTVSLGSMSRSFKLESNCLATGSRCCQLTCAC